MKNLTQLEMRNIEKVFGLHSVLKDVTFSVEKGSIHALVGENGAGKSTLMKILTGIYSHDKGEIYFEGEKVEKQNPNKAIAMGIAMIHQELSPIPELTIAENIFLGREPVIGKTGLIDYNKMAKDSLKLFDRIGVKYDPNKKIKSLSVADMQMIEIVKALSRNAKLIIMDEPTSSLDDKESEVLYSQIKKLKKEGISVIYISHKLNEILSLTDKITVLRDGHIVSSGNTEDYTRGKLITSMVGRKLVDLFPNRVPKVGRPLLQVNKLSSKGKFQDVSFTVNAGEILTITGLVGAGRSELLRCIFGLDKYDSGEIYIDGEQVNIKEPQDAIKHGVVMVNEDRKNVGLVTCRPVSENLSIVNLGNYLKKGLWNSIRE